MGGIKKTLTLERRKKVVEKTANQYLTVVVVSLLITLFFMKNATFATFFDDLLRIIAVFLVFIFTTWRYRHQKSLIKCIDQELEKCEMEKRMHAGRKFRYKP